MYYFNEFVLQDISKERPVSADQSRYSIRFYWRRVTWVFTSKWNCFNPLFSLLENTQIKQFYYIFRTIFCVLGIFMLFFPLIHTTSLLYPTHQVDEASTWPKMTMRIQIAIDLGTCEVVALLLKVFYQLRTSIHDMDASVATIVAVDHIYYFYWTQVKSLATRVEVCHLCRDRRSCKICTSCVTFFSLKKTMHFLA